MCMCVHHIYAGAHRDQKSVLDPLELAVSCQIWVLVTKPWKSSKYP